MELTETERLAKLSRYTANAYLSEGSASPSKILLGLFIDAQDRYPTKQPLNGRQDSKQKKRQDVREKTCSHLLIHFVDGPSALGVGYVYEQSLGALLTFVNNQYVQATDCVRLIPDVLAASSRQAFSGNGEQGNEKMLNKWASLRQDARSTLGGDPHASGLERAGRRIPYRVFGKHMNPVRKRSSETSTLVKDFATQLSSLQTSKQNK